LITVNMPPISMFPNGPLPGHHRQRVLGARHVAHVDVVLVLGHADSPIAM
jgi:hypothetical protein